MTRELAEHQLTELTRGVDWYTGQELDALERLGAAIGLADTAQDVLRYAVESARANGATWQQVADMLEITRQAAQQRFSR